MDLAEVAYVEFSNGYLCEFLTPEIVVIKIRLTGMLKKILVCFVWKNMTHIQGKSSVRKCGFSFKTLFLELSKIFRYLLKLCPMLYLFKDYDHPNVLHIFYQFNFV
jgi:hypothetical protein